MDNFSLADPGLTAVAYIAAVNLVGFLVFAWDKHCARHGKWRVREQTLLLLAAIGGTAGVIVGQQTLRHKTRKEPFKTYLFWIVILQVVILIVLSFPAGREFFSSRFVELLVQ